MGPEYTSVAIDDVSTPPQDVWTLESVAASNKFLIVVENRVVDVSKFIYEHPGGAAALKRERGLDATASFLKVGHSKYATRLLEKMCVGSLGSTTATTPTTPTKPTKLPPLKITPATNTTNTNDTNDTNDVNSINTVNTTKTKAGDTNDTNDTRSVGEGKGFLGQTRASLEAIRDAEKEAENYAVEWHAKRRRAMIEAHPEIVDQFEQSCLALPVGLLACAMHALTCIVAQALPLWCGFLLAYTVGAVCKMYQFMVGHELTHGLVGKWANYPFSKLILLCVVNLPCFGTYLHTYVSELHLGHHRNLGSDDIKGDFELVDGDIVTLNHFLQLLQQELPAVKQSAFGRILVQSLGVVAYIVMASVGEGITMLTAAIMLPFMVIAFVVMLLYRACSGKWLHLIALKTKEKDNKENTDNKPPTPMNELIGIGVGLVLQYVCFISTVYVLCSYPSTHLAHHLPDIAAQAPLVLSEFIPVYGFLYLLMSECFFQGFLMHPFGAYFLTVHRTSSPEGKETATCQPTMSTYSLGATLSSGCLNYHVEHHDFPNVPWWKLPRIRRIAPEFYEHLESSSGFLNSIWNFLVRPSDYVYACN